MSGDNQELGRGCKCFQNKVSENHFFRWIRGDNEKLGKRSKYFFVNMVLNMGLTYNHFLSTIDTFNDPLEKIIDKCKNNPIIISITKNAELLLIFNLSQKI